MSGNICSAIGGLISVLWEAAAYLVPSPDIVCTGPLAMNGVEFYIPAGLSDHADVSPTGLWLAPGVFRADLNFRALTDESRRQYLLDSAVRIVEKGTELGIKNVFVNGYSAKPAAELVSLAWQRLYPNSTPKFHYLGDEANKHIGDKEVPYDCPRVTKNIKNLPDLPGILVSPVLILDDFTVTGSTLREARRIAIENGAKMVHTAALMLERDKKGVKTAPTDVTIMPETFLPKGTHKEGWYWNEIHREIEAGRREQRELNELLPNLSHDFRLLVQRLNVK